MDSLHINQDKHAILLGFVVKYAIAETIDLPAKMAAVHIMYIGCKGISASIE